MDKARFNSKLKRRNKMKILLYICTLISLLNLNVISQNFGNALYFDGVNDYVNMGNASTFNVGSAVTYEAWIKPDTTLSGFILNKWVDFAEDKQFFFSGNRLYFYLYNVFGGTQLISSPVIPLHLFTHVAATYDGSTAKLYINGVFDTSKSVGSGVNNSTGSLYTGYNPVRSGWNPPFKGIIDEVRIWNIARTEAQIQSSMNQQLNGNEPGLTGYWKFNEGSGTITNDATSNHNNGTISGATWVFSGVPVEPIHGNIPDRFSLEQNYPNPFNPVTLIRFSVPVNGKGGITNTKLIVYDVLSREVAVLVNRQLKPGTYEVSWDAGSFSSGVYFYRLESNDYSQTKKMVFIK